MDGTRRPKSSPDPRFGHSAGRVEKNELGRCGYSLHCRQKNRMTAFHTVSVTGIARGPARPRGSSGDLPYMRTLAQSAHDLATGTSCRTLVEECLARILHLAGEGRRTFLKVHADQARAAADYIDTLRRHGAAPSRFAGIPISVKDLLDIAGDVTTAGSVALRDAPAAMRDAVAVARLRAAGVISIRRRKKNEVPVFRPRLKPHA